MANIKEREVWEDHIYQIETSDPVLGGETGIANRQAAQLGARTKYLKNEVEKRAPTHSPAFTGAPTAPTPEQSANNQQIATTAFVKAVVAALVGSSPVALDTLNELAAALGNDPNFSRTILNRLAQMQTAVDGKAAIASPTFTGAPKAPTPAQTTNDTTLATTAFVKTAIAQLVGSAPATLDTLAEIASALGQDANLKNVLLMEIAKKAPLTHKHQIWDIQNLQDSLDGKAGKATTLAGYGITDSIHFVQDNYVGDLNDLEGKNVAYAINHESNRNAHFPPGLVYKWGILQTTSTGMFTRQFYYPDNPADGIWTRNKFRTNDWEAWHRVDVAGLYESVGDVTNLCLDPSLLEPKLGFTWSAGSTQGELVGGKNTRVVSARDNIYGRKIKVRDGDRYYISCEYKRKQGSAPFTPGLYLDFDKNTRRTARATELTTPARMREIGITIQAGAFSRFEGYVDIPHGVETAHLWLQIDQYNTDATQYYVRNVEWRRMTGNVVGVLTGEIADGGTIPLPAGFEAHQCEWHISPSKVYDRGGNDINSIQFSVDSNRRVTLHTENGAHANNRASYIIIGVK